jgi:hypothetical protein
LAEALQYTDFEKQLQFHTGTPSGTGKRAALFHGHGVGVDDAKERIVEYFRQIDRGVSEVLRNGQTPLVLAGVEYLLPLYKEITSSSQVMETGITGNPEGLRAETLQQQAWPLVEPYFRQGQEEAVARYRRYAGTGQALNDISAILLAAYHGRIDTLFVAVGVQQWGTFDPETQMLQMAQEAAPEYEDLLDCAAVYTFLASGTVYAVTPGNVPDDGPIAAVLRY